MRVAPFPAAPMSSTRSNLKLDERSFETLLAAAYTVQEHNAKQKRVGQTPCNQCGNPLELEHKFCGHCGARREEFRPGERMQRKWASLWSMSQSKTGQPNFASLTGSKSDVSAIEAIEVPIEFADPIWGDDASVLEEDPIEKDNTSEFDEPESLVRSPRQQDFAEDPELEPADSGSLTAWNLPIILRFRREDLYLGVAILVSSLALLWVIWAAPVSRSWAKERLTLWQRTLVKVGIAEASPRAAAVYSGDPSVKVWADPHTALYYCYGDEQFGKTPDGHFSTQREAQMDRFSPAARTPCE